MYIIFVLARNIHFQQGLLFYRPMYQYEGFSPADVFTEKINTFRRKMAFGITVSAGVGFISSIHTVSVPDFKMLEQGEKGGGRGDSRNV